MFEDCCFQPILLQAWMMRQKICRVSVHVLVKKKKNSFANSFPSYRCRSEREQNFNIGEALLELHEWEGAQK